MQAYNKQWNCIVIELIGIILTVSYYYSGKTDIIITCVCVAMWDCVAHAWFLVTIGDCTLLSGPSLHHHKIELQV